MTGASGNKASCPELNNVKITRKTGGGRSGARFLRPTPISSFIHPLPWHSWRWPPLLTQQMPGPHPPHHESCHTESERRRSWSRKENNETTKEKKQLAECWKNSQAGIPNPQGSARPRTFLKDKPAVPPAHCVQPAGCQTPVPVPGVCEAGLEFGGSEQS